ncbi:ABC transporter ATP-binding protein [Alteromonas facilis]|uniref:ABC transporter ATP-binding protein n=1 Tax=Alteromonas facilis TaxID=2048004 RepID=UPI000C293C38|nr:ABC transporter ATP-binding protein [Alteromonas facilis]
MLEVQGLAKSYAGSPALIDVSFSVSRGEVVALLGANGSGKTTTINAICRLLDWDAGDIHFDGESVRGMSEYLRSVGAVLGGSRNTNYRLTAAQNAEYFARLRGFSGKAVRTKIDDLEKRLGLDVHRKKEVMKLSTGNKQKAAMLSALSYSPDLLLLDEPTLGLDFTTVEELRNIIRYQAQHDEQGFLITSHDMGFIDDLCTRVVVLEQGRCLFDGNIEALKSRLFRYRLAVSLPPSVDVNDLIPLWLGRHTFALKEDVLNVQFDEPQQCLATMHYLHSHQVNPSELSVQPMTMEQAYQSLVAEDAV